MPNEVTPGRQQTGVGGVIGIIVVLLWTFGGVKSCDPSPDPDRTTSLPSATPRTCSPNYTGCLPITFDLDCGDIWGSVGVVGADVYRLDADFDGIGCE